MIDPERRKQAMERGREMLQRLADRRCIHCGTPVERYAQERRCFYAEPCGHRQGSGKAPE